MSNLKQLLKYEGEITFDKIEDVLTLFNLKMPDTNSPVCKTRLFSIMVECLENAYRHSYNISEKYPQIVVELNQCDNMFILSVGNRINNDELNHLTNRIDELNKLTFSEIKKTYAETIHNAHISPKGGAGLGLLKIIRCSREPFEYNVTETDATSSFITITIKIFDIN